MKYCLDCRYHEHNAYDPHNAVCTKQAFPDIVTGQTSRLTCRETRKDEALCGKSASWFEPREDVPSTPN